MFKIIDLADAPSAPMEAGRGQKTKLVDAGIGAQAIDLHLNRLSPGGPRGKLHKHSVSENVYIVRAGEGELIIEDQSYRIKKDQIVFIPAGGPAFPQQSIRRPLRNFRNLRSRRRQVRLRRM